MTLHTARSTARRTRAFTLMEVMLAAALGAMVVLAAFGLFAALDREQVHQKIVVREAVELSRTQEAMERSMQLLVMSPPQSVVRPGTTSGAATTTATATPTTPDGAPASDGGKGSDSKSDAATGGKADSGRSPASPNASGSGAGTDSKTGATGAAGAAGAAGAPQGRPRLLLEADKSQPAAMSWHGRLVAPQRLEVALLAPPAFPEPPVGMDRRTWQERQRRAKTSPARREDSQRDGTSTTTPARAWTIAEGVRGAFELTLETAGKNQTEPSWTLAWKPISSATTARIPTGTGRDAAPNDTLADAVGADDADPGRAVLATGLTACRWEVYSNRRFVEDCAISLAEQLPAYVRMSVATVTGNTMEWVFEVGWSTGAEPGTVVTGAAAAPGASANGAASTTGTPATTPGTPVVPTPPAMRPVRPMPGSGPMPTPGTVKPITPRTKEDGH